jgi:serine acetyltransferase
LKRSLYLLFGDSFRFVQVILWPLFFPLRLLGPVLDISYLADIGPGLKISHPSLGVVVSAKAVCGRNLELVGGNCVGSRQPTVHGDIRIGDNVVVGVNASVLGPISVGDDSIVGAGTVLVADCPPGSVMVGVPARPLRPVQVNIDKQRA